MSYTAEVLKVMVASPSDVPQERRIARDVIHEWNVVNADDRKIVLLPIGWETHSFPETGERPQALINKRLLAGCDLLMAIFWTRLGSPTGEAPSGTVEEIEEHLAAGKQALIYFSSAPVRPESVDSEQYSALLEFKASFDARGLIEEYEDLTDFRKKLSRHLAQTIIANFSPEQSQGQTVATAPSDSRVPPLSEAAKDLLVEASSDEAGVIVLTETFGGSSVEANKREFIVSQDARTHAKWRGALGELQEEGLIEDRRGEGEELFVTDLGYVVVDALRRNG